MASHEHFTFERLAEGAVLVRGEDNFGTVATVIPADIWASIVCDVSAKGEGDYRWFTARRFHSGEEGSRFGKPDAQGVPALAGAPSRSSYKHEGD